MIWRRVSHTNSSLHSIVNVLDPQVFKAYDVRGLYQTELDEEGAYAIGRAYVEQFEPR
jgi:phosphomannomutase